MFGKLKDLLIKQSLTREEEERIERAVGNRNSSGYDPWGVDPEALKPALGALKHLYRSYFRVKTANIDRVPAGRVLLIANHGGQLPIDGLLVGLSMILDAEPPRLARGMVERWAPGLPFVSTLFARSGHDLRGPMRSGASDEDLAGLIGAVWASRDDRYSEERSEMRASERSRVEMYEIGG